MLRYCEWKVTAKCAGHTPHNSAQLSEHVDLRLNHVLHIMWELWAKNAFALKIAPPAGLFWCVSLQGPFYSTPMNL